MDLETTKYIDYDDVLILALTQCVNCQWIEWHCWNFMLNTHKDRDKHSTGV